MRNSAAFESVKELILTGTDGTVSVTGSALPTTGYYVATPNPFNVSGPRDELSTSKIQLFTAYATSYVGVWTDRATNTVYLDHVEHIQDLQEAEHAARTNGEIAIYDISRNQEVRV